MDDNAKVIAIAKERGLDVELWPTGGGMENVTLVLTRDANGSPWRVWVGSDCTMVEGFSFHREDRFDGFPDAQIWDDTVCPPTGDPVAVVDYIEKVRDIFTGTGTYPDGWEVDEEEPWSDPVDEPWSKEPEEETRWVAYLSTSGISRGGQGYYALARTRDEAREAIFLRFLAVSGRWYPEITSAIGMEEYFGLAAHELRDGQAVNEED